MEKEIKVKGFQCERCGHIWIPRKNIIKVCPKCKSPYFNVPRKIKKKKK